MHPHYNAARNSAFELSITGKLFLSLNQLLNFIMLLSCHITDTNECHAGVKLPYKGHMNTTTNGKACAPWTEVQAKLDTELVLLVSNGKLIHPELDNICSTMVSIYCHKLSR